MRHPLYPDQLFVTFQRPFFFTYITESYLRSERHKAYKFYTLYPQRTAFLDGDFYLRVENVTRVLDQFFLRIKSW